MAKMIAEMVVMRISIPSVKILNVPKINLDATTSNVSIMFLYAMANVIV